MNARRGLLMGGVAVVALAALGTAGRFDPFGDAPDRVLSAEDAHARAIDGDIVLVDIRRPDEWAQTGIPGGAHPLDMRRDDFVSELRSLVDGRTVPLALICARGGRSGHLAARLKAAGFTDVYDVAEGMLGSAAGAGWLRKGLPLTSYDQDPA